LHGAHTPGSVTVSPSRNSASMKNAARTPSAASAARELGRKPGRRARWSLGRGQMRTKLGSEQRGCSSAL